MKKITINNKWASIISFILILPFVFLNTVVILRIDPFFTLIRPGVHSSAFEFLLLFISLLFFPLAFFMAIQPMIHKGRDGKRKLYPFNIILALIIFTFMIFLWGGLSEDIIACDILQIPQCD